MTLTGEAKASGPGGGQGNPILPGIYTADPDAFVHDGRLYLDLPRLSLADFNWANRNAWAPQLVQRDGKFVWYVPNHSSFDIDPTVLIDDDGQAYIYGGSFSSPRAAKLEPNMIELDDLDDGGTGGSATGPRVTGRLGSALKLNGVADQVNLPAGILGGLSDFTIATWVNLAARPTLVPGLRLRHRSCRHLVPHRQRRSRAAVRHHHGRRWSRAAAERDRTVAARRLDPPRRHAVRHDRDVYVDGPPVATNPAMTLHPGDLGATGNNWIGRPQYSDPFLDTTMDDFRIYDRALALAEVQALAAGASGSGNIASYRFDEAGGAEVVDSSGNGRTAPYLFKRDGLYYLAYARRNPRTDGNPATIDYATGNTAVRPVNVPRPHPRHSEQHHDQPLRDRGSSGTSG